jgi:F-type H+-transporting ATPase subunit b
MELSMELSIEAYKVIITIINFFILYAILRYKLFKPVMKIIGSRQKDIEYSIKVAEEDELSAKNNKLETETELKNSKLLGKGIVEDYKTKAQVLSDDIIKQAQKEAQAIIERAEKEAQREKEKAEYELKKQTVDLAVLLSSKALGDTIDEEQHRKLIKEFISKVGA